MTTDYSIKATAAGRVNLIGEHIDYCGGKVFPAALTFKNTVYIRPNGTDKINLSWTTLPDKVELDINKLAEYKSLKYGNYQAGAAYIWQSEGHKIVGCDMLQDCTVPFGSGLSSSAAIEVSTIAALAALAGEKIDPVKIALAAQRAEREYVGMNCGIMDQYASACGKKDMAMLLDCATLDCEYVPLRLGDYSLVITNTNKPHNLVESKYNERRAQTEEALSILKEKLGVSALAQVTAEELEQNRGALSETVYRRAKHVVDECARVNSAVAALKAGDILSFGKLLNESHKSLKELYEVTGKELDALAESAQQAEGCIGSRMTGGGFGGCTVSIVKSGYVPSFKSFVTEKYELATGYKPLFYVCSPDDGITVEEL